MKDMEQLQQEISANPADTAALNKLVAYTSDKLSMNRGNALAYLGQIHVRDQNTSTEIALTFCRGLGDPEQSVRRVAAEGLINFGPAAKLAMDALIKALDEGDDDVAWFAANALGNLGVDAAPAVPGLIKALNTPHAPASPGAPQLRTYAAEALGKIGSAASAALPALQKASGNADAEFSSAAKKGMQQILQLQTSHQDPS